MTGRWSGVLVSHAGRVVLLHAPARTVAVPAPHAPAGVVAGRQWAGPTPRLWAGGTARVWADTAVSPVLYSDDTPVLYSDDTPVEYA